MSQYIIVNNNIWKIHKEFILENIEKYIIKTRNSMAFINKDDCFLVDGSSLLHYNKEYIDIDVCDMSYRETNDFCKNCLYVKNCMDSFIIKDCEYYCDEEMCEEVFEWDKEVDFGYLDDINKEEEFKWLVRKVDIREIIV